MASENHFTASIIKTSTFSIQTFLADLHTNHAVIYIEGDGLVINRFGNIAINPTPTDPMALRLACVDPRPLTKIVINRPYHFLKIDLPNSKYWTTGRYAPEVIQSIIETIKIFQKQFDFKTFEIVAYSGGASVALCLVPHFKNITEITTFAGNLDHKNWTNHHNTQQLYESIDPLENLKPIKNIEQIHYVGTSDDNTTIDLATAFKKRVNSPKISVIPVDGYNHDSNWTDIWSENLKLK